MLGLMALTESKAMNNTFEESNVRPQSPKVKAVIYADNNAHCGAERTRVAETEWMRPIDFRRTYPISRGMNGKNGSDALFEKLECQLYEFGQKLTPIFMVDDGREIPDPRPYEEDCE